MSLPVPGQENVAQCSCCRRFVVLVPLPGGVVWVTDPDFRQRRFIRSLLGPAAVGRQGFGPGLGTLHYCFPADTPLERKRLYEGEHLAN